MNFFTTADLTHSFNLVFVAQVWPNAEGGTCLQLAIPGADPEDHLLADPIDRVGLMEAMHPGQKFQVANGQLCRA